ncbi:MULTISPECIES: hypothetical protein [Streptomyces]|uniref:Uncharacterized protein n=1 Tax=Streptomyces pseudovenezuelae TaxID=67350 RepID=A0A117PP33_9ACTN|nr:MULTISPECIES: hypothetical protein [Streptomyces]KUM83885.1 hypothetical protein AQI94_33595 [Streptomyces pseudovenezuelae]
MHDTGTPLAEADYIGATAHELSEKRAAAKIAAGIDQKTLFQRRGRIILRPGLLVLTGWSDNGDLALTRADITAAETRFTPLYGRFLGGLLNAGQPLILTTTKTSADEVYLLVNHRGFLETTDDRAWEKRIERWRRG